MAKTYAKKGFKRPPIRKKTSLRRAQPALSGALSGKSWFVIACVCATALLGLTLYQVKYEVVELEHKLDRTYAQLQQEQEAIRVLTAEWEYLASPAHLRGMKHATSGTAKLNTTHPTQVISIEDLDGVVTSYQAKTRPRQKSTNPFIQNTGYGNKRDHYLQKRSPQKPARPPRRQSRA